MLVCMKKTNLQASALQLLRIHVNSEQPSNRGGSDGQGDKKTEGEGQRDVSSSLSLAKVDKSLFMRLQEMLNSLSGSSPEKKGPKTLKLVINNKKKLIHHETFFGHSASNQVTNAVQSIYCGYWCRKKVSETSFLLCFAFYGKNASLRERLRRGRRSSERRRLTTVHSR